uniref:K Homology domain-containing protein n=1 Tax=Panagrolaimus superbus TaxID=310955 RepID=A0A914YIA9_9BILA
MSSEFTDFFFPFVFQEKTIGIPDHLCGYIIGTKGRTIKEMQERHGVKLILLDETIIVTKKRSSGIHLRQFGKPLKIIGSPEKIEAVLVEIEKMLKHGGLPGIGPTGWHASDEKMRRLMNDAPPNNSAKKN